MRSHRRFLMRLSVVCGCILSVILLAAATYREDPVLVLVHTPQGMVRYHDMLSLRFSLRVENRGKAPLHRVALEHVPRSMVSAGGVALAVGTLGPGEARTVSFSIVTPDVPGEADRIAGGALVWTGNGIGAGGDTVEFETESAAGGSTGREGARG